MKKVIYLVLILSHFSCVSVEKKLLKHPDGNFNKKKENRAWKKTLNEYKSSMTEESKTMWGSATITSQ